VNFLPQFVDQELAWEFVLHRSREEVGHAQVIVEHSCTHPSVDWGSAGTIRGRCHTSGFVVIDRPTNLDGGGSECDLHVFVDIEIAFPAAEWTLDPLSLLQGIQTALKEELGGALRRPDWVAEEDERVRLLVDLEASDGEEDKEESPQHTDDSGCNIS